MNEYGEYWPEDEYSMVANYVWGQLELKGGSMVRDLHRDLKCLLRQSDKAERKGDRAEASRVSEKIERVFVALDYLCGPAA